MPGVGRSRSTVNWVNVVLGIGECTFLSLLYQPEARHGAIRDVKVFWTYVEKIKDTATFGASDAEYFTGKGPDESIR
jgi:hypothetical protein